MVCFIALYCGTALTNGWFCKLIYSLNDWKLTEERFCSEQTELEVITCCWGTFAVGLLNWSDFLSIVVLSSAGVGNLRLLRHLRLFSSSEVALSGFGKTRNLNLHFIVIRFKLITL